MKTLFEMAGDKIARSVVKGEIYLKSVDTQEVYFRHGENYDWRYYRWKNAIMKSLALVDSVAKKNTRLNGRKFMWMAPAISAKLSISSMMGTKNTSLKKMKISPRTNLGMTTFPKLKLKK